MRAEFSAHPPFHGKDAVESVQQNLGELDKRKEMLYRARAFWIGELIPSLDADTLSDRDRMLSLCEQLFGEDSADDAYAAAAYRADVVALCSELAAGYPAGYEQAYTALFGEYEPTLSPDAQGRVAYVANSYTEQAFMELTGFIKGRRVAYFHGFDDVCQEVRSGLCEYGILPVESTKEGMLAGLLRLIELYDLRICALCYVPTPQSGSTAFALVRSTLPLAQPSARHCLDILLSPASPADTGRLISIASLCSHELLHAAGYTGHSNELFRLKFAINPPMLYPFLLYLLLFGADITPIGFYAIK